jgi:hypothetical protein
LRADECRVEGKPEGRRRRWRSVLTGLLCTLGLLYAAGVVASVARPHGRLPDLSDTPSATRVDDEFSRVASALARDSVSVRCWSHLDWKRRGDAVEKRWPKVGHLGPWRGYTWWEPWPTVHLSPEICIELTRLRWDPEPVQKAEWRDALAWSLSALAHESVHASGEIDEAKAHGWGMQRMRTAAVLLGRSAEEGQYLAERFWKRWYRSAKPPYESPECRNGGALDLRPGDDTWP